LANGEDAYQLMRDLGIGISDADLLKIPLANQNLEGIDTDNDGLSDRVEDSLGTNKNNQDTDQDGYSDRAEILNGYDPLSSRKLPLDKNFANLIEGRIFLQVEKHGEAWYVNPENKQRYYLGNGDDAYQLMRFLSLGITNSDLAKIETESLEEVIIEPQPQPQSQPPCSDECTIFGQNICSEDKVSVCGNFDEDICLEWSSPESCRENYECFAGLCFLDAQQILPLDNQQQEDEEEEEQTEDEQQEQQNQNEEPEDEEEEQGGQQDQDEEPDDEEDPEPEPEPTCTDECVSLDGNQCSGQGYKTCGNYDNDDCLEWSVIQNCEEQYECSQGQCSLSGAGSNCPIIAVSVNKSVIDGNWGDDTLEGQYRTHLEDLFAWAMPAGTAKWPFVHPEQDVYNPVGIQNMLDWFNGQGMSYDIFHNVVVPKYSEIPDWYWDMSSPEEKLIALEDHVRTIMAHFGTQIPIYNVVNHVYNNHFKNNSENYLQTGLDRLTVVDNILTWAKEANPNVKLIINEGGDTSSAGVITDSSSKMIYIQFLNDLLARGAPLEGIGLMGHLGRDVGQGAGKLPADVLRQSLEDYSQFGLPIYITEFDISYYYILDSNPSFNPDDQFENYDSWWDYQADAYMEAFEVFSEYPLVKMIHLWDIYDGISWLPGTGLFDEDFNPKPVYYRLENFLRDAKVRTCNL